LSEAETIIEGRSAVVYVDPPYRREEYSRYYHLLETLTDYSYPSVVGKGRVPDKSRGERFRSEFSTRNKMKMAQSLAVLISGVLERGWTCAWSYADSSDANIRDVLDLVAASQRTEMWSFAAPYDHHAHGGGRPKHVTEYLLFLKPKA
jgi:adenine-specific DNA methylase